MISNETLQNYINNVSNNIEGWFYPFDMVTFAQLNNIQKNLGITGSLCELGVYKAKSFVLMSHMVSENEKLFGFDLFPDNLEEQATETIKKYGAKIDLEFIKSNTSDLTTENLNKKLQCKLRMLHIDAGHEYHEVLHQLLIFAQYVTDGGVIIMDDYQDRKFPGIEAAVLDFCEIDRPRRFVPFYSGANKIYLCETNYTKKYQECLLSFDSIRNNSRITRVKDFYILIGGSKLPMNQENIMEIINQYAFPKYYAFHEERTAEFADKYNQIKHM